MKLSITSVLPLMLMAGAALAQPQDAKQRACINKLNLGLERVYRSAARNVELCVRDGSRGQLGAGISDIDECVIQDPRSLVAKATAKTVGVEAKSCGVEPQFAATGAATVNMAGQLEAEALFEGVFGSVLEDVIAKKADDPDVARCQERLANAIPKCVSVRLKEFNKCKKQALRSIASGAELEQTCLMDGAPTTGQPDPKGRISKACDRLDVAGDDGVFKQMLKCNKDGVLSTEALPACPGGGSFSNVHEQCVIPRTACSACLAIVGADDLSRDCDLFDNGVADGSCPF